MSGVEFQPARRGGKTAALSAWKSYVAMDLGNMTHARILEGQQVNQEFSAALAKSVVARAAQSIQPGKAVYFNSDGQLLEFITQKPDPVKVSAGLRFTETPVSDYLDCMAYAMELVTHQTFGIPDRLYDKVADPEPEVIVERFRRINLE